MDKRLYGLDSLRAILLLIGPLIHGTSYVYLTDNTVVWADLITRTSNVFRMETFFLIAGFLVATSHLKGKAWLHKRMIQLGVPLAVGWFGITMPIAWLTHQPTWYSPNHMWFLMTLMVATVTFYALDHCHKITYTDRFPIGKAIVTLVALKIMAYLGMRYLPDIRYTQSMATIILNTPYYLTWYAIGLGLKRDLRLRTLVSDHRKTLMTTGVLLLVGYLLQLGYFHSWTQQEGHHGWKMLSSIYATLCGVFIALGLVGYALKVSTKQPTLDGLSKSCYTVYILHFPIIYILALAKPDLDARLQVIWLALGSAAISIAIHQLVVNKSPLVAFLLNGKMNGRLTLWHKAKTPCCNPA